MENKKINHISNIFFLLFIIFLLNTVITFLKSSDIHILFFFLSFFSFFSGIFAVKRIYRIEISLTLAFLISVLYIGGMVIFNLNIAQFQLIWFKLYKIFPFGDSQRFLLQCFHRIFESFVQKDTGTSWYIVTWVVAPAVSFILIGCPFYYLIGRWLYSIWLGASFVLGKTRQSQDSQQFILRQKYLFITSIISFIIAVFFIISFEQWTKINFKNSMLGNYTAKQDFIAGKQILLIQGPGKIKKFTGKKVDSCEIWIYPQRGRGIPYLIDKFTFIDSYNLEMLRLVNKHLKNKGYVERDN